MSVTMEFFDGITFDIAKQKYYNANKVDARMEVEAGAIVAEELPEAAISLSHRIGRTGLLARESAAILNYGVVLLGLAALFQLADGMQVMALGLLRGVKDTKVPMGLAAVSYWLIGIPCSYVLAFPLGFGGVGLWLGLVVGLACASASLMWRFWHMVRVA